MNNLTKYLVQNLLEEDSKKTVALYAGGFKPPTKGHFEVVKKALTENPNIDEFIIFIGSGIRDGIGQSESLQIWELYKKYLPFKVRLEPVKAPIKSVLNYAKENPTETILWVLGAREDNPEDWADLASRTRSLDKYPNMQLRVIQTKGGVSGTAARKAIKTNSKEQFFNLIPDIKEKDQVWDLVSPIIAEASDPEVGTALPYGSGFAPVKETTNEGEVKCNNCGWKWKLADGGKDPYICHKCGNDNNPTDFTKLKQAFMSLAKYMIEQNMNIDPFPKIKFINDDKENASELLGKTAYYDPNNKEIVLYTLDRHPKDILRSFCHEIIHYIQDLEGRLNNITTTNTNEGGDLPEIEREAYEKGNMLFRNWEDKIKSTKYIKEYKQYVLTELFEKDLPIVDKVSKNLYIVTNEDDIEAKYDFRLEIPSRNIWSMNWFFTPNNKNKSPEAWKKVTATSFKVLEDWLQYNKPKSLHISGNTESKTTLYKNYINKLETLLNNRYKIDNSDEHSVVLRSIEEISKPNIKKRMDTLNESYEQSLYYWQNGDLNSKSKIERWSAIKRKVKREVLQEIYNINTTPQYQIYCDMDGVLVDFDKGYKNLVGVEPSSVLDKNEFWDPITEKGAAFWITLKWMEDGKQLWDYISKYEPTLLSAPSREESSKIGKRVWVKRELPGVKLILKPAAQKQQLASPTAILIDDRISNVNQWEERGGIGILHINAKTTIDKLKSLGL
jgi:hypothetical protein